MVPSFGYKSRLSTCRAFGFIRKGKITDGAHYDGKMLRDVVTKDNTASDVWADIATNQNPIKTVPTGAILLNSPLALTSEGSWRDRASDGDLNPNDSLEIEMRLSRDERYAFYPTPCQLSLLSYDHEVAYILLDLLRSVASRGGVRGYDGSTHLATWAKLKAERSFYRLILFSQRERE